MAALRDAVPQDLVIALVVSLVHEKPVLVTSAFNLRQIESQVIDIGEALTGPINRDYGIVNCSPDIPWSLLEPRFSHCERSVLVLKNIERLSADVQLQLGYALMQPGQKLKEFLVSSALVFTSKSIPDKLHPLLRRQILMKRDLDLLDDDCPMIELPESKTWEETREQTEWIRSAIDEVTIVPELLRYIHDILIFVRTHRLTRLGIQPNPAAAFELLVRTLCVLEGKNFATPLLIRKAAKLALPVHVRLCTAEDEPSLQYGGDISMVRSWIKEWDGDVLVDSVLEEVPVPG